MIFKIVIYQFLILSLSACNDIREVDICNGGRIDGDFLASPVDGGGFVVSSGRRIAVSAGYEGHRRIREAANSSKFKLFFVPVHIVAECEYTEYVNGKFLDLKNIKSIVPNNEDDVLEGLYKDYGAKPVLM
jgi:hypothetical protein